MTIDCKYTRTLEAIKDSDECGCLRCLTNIFAGMMLDAHQAAGGHEGRKPTGADQQGAMELGLLVVAMYANIAKMPHLIAQMYLVEGMQQTAGVAKKMEGETRKHLKDVLMGDPDLEKTDIGDLMAAILKGGNDAAG